MSRTVRGSKPAGYDFWSRRGKAAWGYGGYAKQLTKRRERKEDKDICTNNFPRQGDTSDSKPF